MKKKRILFILHMPPPVHGAAMVGKYIHDSLLVNESFECHYVNLSTARDLADIGKFGVRKMNAYLRLIRNVKEEVNTFRPDLVYITPNSKGGAFYKEFFLVQMLKGMGCNVVAHYHNKGVRTKQGQWLYNRLYRAFFENLKVILLSEALYGDVSKYVDKNNVYVCPNGIPMDNPIEPMAERNNDIPHILFLSNLLESKGALVLLDALKVLRENGNSFICDFVGGETAEIDAFRFKLEIEKRKLNNYVMYHGRKYGKEKEAFLKIADIFVFPSINETFGLVNLEAMEYKIPIVTTNEGGIPDVVRNGLNGLVVDVSPGQVDVHELADSIAILLDNKDLRQKMGTTGYNILKEHFTLKQFEQRITDILKDCLKYV